MRALYLILLTLFLVGVNVCDAAAGSRPNVLLIVVDDLNTELGCYGNSVVKSPNIDRLAARGVRFDRAYCQFALCNPSRISFLSGQRPETTGVYVAAKTPRQALPDAIMLPQLFRQAGYFSAGAGKVYHSTKHSDPLSWDFYQDGEGKDDQENAALGARYKGGDRTPRGYALNGDGSKSRDGLNTREISGYLAQYARSGKHFFLALGLHKPHLPWTAPKRFFDLYPPRSIPVPNDPSMRGIPAVALQTELSGFPKPPSRAEAIAAYYACISFTDDNLRIVLNELDRGNLWENTVVVFLGDNGFHLGDHGDLWGKFSVFENATRVPLILAGAGVPAGKIVTQPVELLDVFPTVAELCGLTPPPGLEGKSLLPVMKSNKELPSSHAYSMIHHYDVTNGTDILGRSVRTADYRYTQWSNQNFDRELYLVGQKAEEYRNQAGNLEAKTQMAQGERLLRELKKHKPGPTTRPNGLLKGKNRDTP